MGLTLDFWYCIMEGLENTKLEIIVFPVRGIIILGNFWLSRHSLKPLTQECQTAGTQASCIMLKPCPSQLRQCKKKSWHVATHHVTLRVWHPCSMWYSFYKIRARTRVWASVTINSMQIILIHFYVLKLKTINIFSSIKINSKHTPPQKLVLSFIMTKLN